MVSRKEQFLTKITKICALVIEEKRIGNGDEQTDKGSHFTPKLYCRRYNKWFLDINNYKTV